jgi:L-fuconolactonase
VARDDRGDGGDLCGRLFGHVAPFDLVAEPGAKMMRLDSHQHFWRYNVAEYGWITSDKALLRRDYLPADLQPLLVANGFDGSIAVQARQTLEETAWLLSLAEQHDFIKGVVGWVDLCSRDLAGQLERFGRHPKLVGVRHVVHDEPDDDFMLRSDFRRGLSRLADCGLAYDLLIFVKHLPAAFHLAEEFPAQRFVLDHIAKPDIRSRKISPWDQGIRELALLPNVSCKLSGMVTEAEWQHWQPSDYSGYLDLVMAAFGTERLMIGSDWPVCTLSSPYGATMGIVAQYIEQFPPVVRQQILGGNCARAYGIEQQDTL